LSSQAYYFNANLLGDLSTRTISTVDAAVASYLVTLATPQDGTICQPDHAPFDPDFGKPLP
jgi:hypothetical protein